MRAPPRALIPTIKRRWTSLRPVAQQKRWESTERKEGPSFKGQLYESTAKRLIKERAERVRFAQERDEGSSGRSWSITFGTYPFMVDYRGEES
jgi:D-lactate dehydrogenase (cytochrome)